MAIKITHEDKIHPRGYAYREFTGSDGSNSAKMSHIVKHADLSESTANAAAEAIRSTFEGNAPRTPYVSGPNGTPGTGNALIGPAPEIDAESLAAAAKAAVPSLDDLEKAAAKAAKDK